LQTFSTICQENPAGRLINFNTLIPHILMMNAVVVKAQNPCYDTKWKVLHFYKKPYPRFDAIDMGIALCHFELTCRELGIGGKFEILKDFPDSDSFKYVVSWV